jgi:hypothetical protein
LARHQLCVRADVVYAAVFHHDDPVGNLRRAKAVGDYYRGLSTGKLGEFLVKLCFLDRVDRRRWLVKDYLSRPVSTSDRYWCLRSNCDAALCAL